MTTYLNLCKRLRQEAGISGTGPDTVIGQTGELKRVVDWIATAYDDIQKAHATWRFLRTDFEFTMTIAKNTYSPSDLSITDFATWIIEHRDDTGAIRIYNNAADESRMQYLPWDEFREAYVFGNNRTQTQRPSVVTVKPDNSLMFWAIPDVAFTCNGERYKSAAVLTADDDEPNFPERFHIGVVWKALMYYGTYESAPEKYDWGLVRHKASLRKLEMDQLERILHGPPLA